MRLLATTISPNYFTPRELLRVCHFLDAEADRGVWDHDLDLSAASGIDAPMATLVGSTSNMKIDERFLSGCIPDVPDPSQTGRRRIRLHSTRFWYQGIRRRIADRSIGKRIPLFDSCPYSKVDYHQSPFLKAVNNHESLVTGARRIARKPYSPDIDSS